MTDTLQRFTHSVKAMGSRCEFQIYAENTRQAKTYFSLAESRLFQLEQKYSRYRDDSVVSRINSAAGTGTPVEVDKETAGLLHYADTLYKESEGLFDVTSGVLRKAWDFRSGKLPEASTVENLLRYIGWHKARWAPPFFQLTEKNMEIDFGGFVKEFAADQIALCLKNNGLNHGFVNLGGDIVVIGPHPDNSPWIIGIQHPRVANKAIAQIPLRKGAIATSGDYERFMLIDGKRYCHLLNPLSGYPIQSAYVSVSVINEQCLISGSFSSLAMMKAEKDPYWIEQSGVTYLAITQSLEVLPKPLDL